MEKLTYSEFRDNMFKHNEGGRNQEAITGVIVYKSSNWPDQAFTETERSYRTSSTCNGFCPGKISNSVFGNCLDGSEFGVRLDWYNWDVEYCYMD